MTTGAKSDVAVIGGGITGQAAAYRLSQAGAQVTLLEASDRLGGMVHTDVDDGFVIDDHVPHVVDDTVWGHRGRAYATGYIAGVLRARRGRAGAPS